jgi:hypothetical protein
LVFVVIVVREICNAFYNFMKKTLCSDAENRDADDSDADNRDAYYRDADAATETPTNSVFFYRQ